MSGEWHTGEVINLCKSYGFIRISKDGKSEDIFFYYGDVKGREPQLGDHVSFELAADARYPDRQKAVAVEYSRPGDDGAPDGRGARRAVLPDHALHAARPRLRSRVGHHV